jgi:hypothetical protein
MKNHDQSNRSNRQTQLFSRCSAFFDMSKVSLNRLNKLPENFQILKGNNQDILSIPKLFLEVADISFHSNVKFNQNIRTKRLTLVYSGRELIKYYNRIKRS